MYVGMDPSGFRSVMKGDGGEEGRRGDDNDKFIDCQLPCVICPSCSIQVQVSGATVSIYHMHD